MQAEATTPEAHQCSAPQSGASRHSQASWACGAASEAKAGTHGRSWLLLEAPMSLQAALACQEPSFDAVSPAGSTEPCAAPAGTLRWRAQPSASWRSTMHSPWASTRVTHAPTPPLRNVTGELNRWRQLLYLALRQTLGGEVDCPSTCPCIDECSPRKLGILLKQPHAGAAFKPVASWQTGIQPIAQCTLAARAQLQHKASNLLWGLGPSSAWLPSQCDAHTPPATSINALQVGHGQIWRTHC